MEEWRDFGLSSIDNQKELNDQVLRKVSTVCASEGAVSGQKACRQWRDDADDLLRDVPDHKDDMKIKMRPKGSCCERTPEAVDLGKGGQIWVVCINPDSLVRTSSVASYTQTPPFRRLPSCLPSSRQLLHFRSESLDASSGCWILLDFSRSRSCELCLTRVCGTTHKGGTARTFTRRLVCAGPEPRPIPLPSFWTPECRNAHRERIASRIMGMARL